MSKANFKIISQNNQNIFQCSHRLGIQTLFCMGIAWPQSQFPHSCVCECFTYSQDLSIYFRSTCRIGRQILVICINLSQIYEFRNGETEHYNSVFEITVSFLGIHKWEPDIILGFSLALHLQCSTLWTSNLIALLQSFPKKAVHPKILQQRKSSAIMS